MQKYLALNLRSFDYGINCIVSLRKLYRTGSDEIFKPLLTNLDFNHLRLLVSVLALSSTYTLMSVQQILPLQGMDPRAWPPLNF